MSPAEKMTSFGILTTVCLVQRVSALKCRGKFRTDVETLADTMDQAQWTTAHRDCARASLTHLDKQSKISECGLATN